MGSTSVAAALEILGYEVLHVCPLTHIKHTKEFLEELYNRGEKSLVSTGDFFGEYIKTCLDENQIDWPVLILERDLESWKNSIKLFDWKGKSIGTYNKLLDNKQVFRYNVKDGWGPLCSVLGKEKPEVPFPRLNAIEDWTI
jgi:hypothetical protein